MFPNEWKLLLAGIGLLALIGAAGGVALAIERHGEAAGRATLQPQLDRANADLATVRAAQQASEQTIAELRANDAANDALVATYRDQVDALHQQAADVSATIRKLQADDQTVDAYLRTHIPDALRGVYDDQPAGAAAAAGHPHGEAAAAR